MTEIVNASYPEHQLYSSAGEPELPVSSPVAMWTHGRAEVTNATRRDQANAKVETEQPNDNQIESSRMTTT